MGRWSRQVAAAFLARLDAPAGADWVELGCGTGALTAAVLAAGAPRSLVAVDPSEDFLAAARAAVPDPRVRFERGQAGALPAADATIDVAVSGLVLNFVPDRPAALADLLRALRPGGGSPSTSGTMPGAGSSSSTASGRRRRSSTPRPPPSTRRAASPSRPAMPSRPNAPPPASMTSASSRSRSRRSSPTSPTSGRPSPLAPARRRATAPASPRSAGPRSASGWRDGSAADRSRCGLAPGRHGDRRRPELRHKPQGW